MEINPLVESKFGESLGGLNAITQTYTLKINLDPYLSSEVL